MNFLKSLGFAAVIYLLASGTAGGFATIGWPSGPTAYVTGTLVAIFVATRDRYKPDWQAWLLLLLGPIGWCVAFWRRFNQLDRRRRPEAITTSV